jgi:hypothetical protein
MCIITISPALGEIITVDDENFSIELANSEQNSDSINTSNTLIQSAISQSYKILQSQGIDIKIE